MRMRKLSSIVPVGVAIVLLATASFGQAAALAGHGFSGPPSSRQFDSHRGFDGRRRDLGRRSEGGVFVDVPYDSAPATAYYYYYCPNSAAYYPTVTSCSEEWIQVPAE